MKIKDVITSLETIAPPSLQEGYDNAGLITGEENAECTGILISLDATTAVVDEASKKGCNLIISHHTIVFSGLKKIKKKLAREIVLELTISLYETRLSMEAASRASLTRAIRNTE